MFSVGPGFIESTRGKDAKGPLSLYTEHVHLHF